MRTVAKDDPVPDLEINHSARTAPPTPLTTRRRPHQSADVRATAKLVARAPGLLGYDPETIKLKIQRLD